MQHSSKVPVKLSPVYGIIIGVICIAMILVFYMTNQYGTLWAGFGTCLVFFLGIMLSIVHFNARHGNKTSMMSSFAMGFRATLQAIFLVAVFSLIFYFLVVNREGHYEIQQQIGRVTNVVGSESSEQQKFWVMFLGNVLFANFVMGVLAAGMGALVFKANQKTTKNEPE